MKKLIKESKISGLKTHININMLIMLSGNLLTVFINVLIVKLLTNKYSTEDYGIYSLIISFTVFPQLVIYAPIASAIFPFIKSKKDENKYVEFQRDIFDLFFLTTIVLIILLVILSWINFYTNILSSDKVYICILTLFFSSTLSWLSTLDTFSLANSRIKLYTFFPVINMAIKLIVILFLFNANVIPQTLILFFCLFQLVLCFIEFSYLRKTGILTFLKWELKRIFNINSVQKIEILKYSKNFFIWGLFGWAQSFFDKWFLNHYVGAGTVAMYAVYYQYGFFPFTIFSSLISQYITPIFFSKTGDFEQEFSFLKRLLFLCILFLIGTSVVMTLLAKYLAPFLIELLTNADYLENIHLFPIIVLAGCLYGFGQIITIPLLKSEFVERVKFPKIGSSLIAMILFFTLTPKLGLLGILLALIISNLFYFVILFSINLKYINNLKNKFTV